MHRKHFWKAACGLALAAAIGAAFGLLGQIATQGIFNDPAVAAGVNELDKFYDRKKLEAVMQEK